MSGKGAHIGKKARVGVKELPKEDSLARPVQPEVILRAEAIKFSYGGVPILDIDNLEVFKGETLCLMGPNGAGKSTLVRLLNLVEKPDSGKIMFMGQETSVNDLRTRRRMAGVFQRPYLFKGSVYDNVTYGLRLRRVPQPLQSRRVAKVLEMLGLSELANKDARSLSGGEAQRVALARAMVVEPEVFFLDEPASALDPQAGKDFQRDLRRIVTNGRTTAVYVTHSLEEALRTGDRIAVMKEGKIMQIGPSEDVYRAPADLFVARFLGVENLLPGRVVDAVDGGAVVELKGGGRIYTCSPCSPAGGEASPAGGEVVVLIRAEEVSLYPLSWAAEPSITANRFPGTVVSIISIGSTYQVTIDCGFSLVATLTRPRIRELGLKAGTQVEARFDESSVRMVAA